MQRVAMRELPDRSFDFKMTSRTQMPCVNMVTTSVTTIAIRAQTQRRETIPFPNSMNQGKATVSPYVNQYIEYIVIEYMICIGDGGATLR